MSRLTRDGTAEPVSRDQIFRCERGQGDIHFPCSADHEQDWQPYPVDLYSCYNMCEDYDHTRHKYYNSTSSAVRAAGLQNSTLLYLQYSILYLVHIFVGIGISSARSMIVDFHAGLTFDLLIVYHSANLWIKTINLILQ